MQPRVRAPVRPTLIAAAMLIVPGLACAQDNPGIPNIPEPMVFDMVRPLGARAGELEANTLAQVNASGPDRTVEWAPEVELAVLDGFAVELELPLSNLNVTEYKMGLQGTFGTFNGGRSIHGVQYLGVYDRADGRWRSTLLYLLGHRFDERWSTMTMVGVGDRTFTGGNESGAIVNHTTFYDVDGDTVLGLELNSQTGAHGHWLAMPQAHHDFGRIAVQVGMGAEKQRDAPVRPRLGLRLIHEF